VPLPTTPAYATTSPAARGVCSSPSQDDGVGRYGELIQKPDPVRGLQHGKECTDGVQPYQLPHVGSLVQGREQLDNVAVGVEHQGVALTPDLVPRRCVALVTERADALVLGVDFGRGVPLHG